MYMVVMVWEFTDMFPDNEGRNGSQNVGLFTIKLFITTDSLRTFYPV
jgi:hypothetical protein